MKRQVRHGVFETNSSSMHSITVMKDGEYYTSGEILDGIYLHKDKDTGEEECVWEPLDRNMEFGRSPFKTLGTFADKWLYACASLVGEYNSQQYKELEALALKYVPGLKKIILPTTIDSFPNKEKDNASEYSRLYGKTEEELLEYLDKKAKEWGWKKVDYWESHYGDWHFDKPYTGYVDENILSGFLLKEGITLEEYLTNKRYVVIVDGDEYCIYEEMKEYGLIDLNAIDHEYPED